LKIPWGFGPPPPDLFSGYASDISAFGDVTDATCRHGYAH